jgi:pimeloyl-ACP methyl ester carboxylesterase
MEYVSQDGVRLAYVDEGEGDPPILLVHGMRCNHTHMLPLLRHLSERHRVVALDLRGHGESDKPEGAYSNAVMAGDLVGLCAALGLVRPVAIGHSFGGSVSLYLAWSRPDFLSGLVLLDSGVRTPAEKEAELGPVISEVTAEATRRAGEFLAARLFGPDDPADLRDRIIGEMMSSVPPHAAAAMGRTVLEFDSGTAAAECRVPALFILADRPFTTNEMLARLGPNWRVGKVVGAGHFVQMVAPDQVHAMVDRFLQLLSTTRS